MNKQSDKEVAKRKDGRVPTAILYAGVQTEEPEEKPWKRVSHSIYFFQICLAVTSLCIPRFDIAKKGTHLYEPVKSVPSTLLLVLLGFYLLLGFLTYLEEERSPSVVRESDVRVDDSSTFSEEAAWRYLRILLGDQPRVAGTRYHLQKAKDLKELLDSVAASGRHNVYTDWQLVSGDFWIAFNRPNVNLYQNVSNIVAVLEGESGFLSNGSISTSILVNCHYDSVPYALGVSDNAIFCAAMVETLSRLSRRQQKLKHNVIFLFNGAEENSLQGSHGFLQHPWSRNMINVINLDSAGINGKANLFQVTDPRLLRIFQSTVSNPSAQSLGEFLFSTGIVPSDTDFRVWRDFGGIQGVDIAFVKGGQVYHTRYDHPDMVEPGVIQYAGNMLLALVTAVADDESLTEKIEPSAAVYYDYLHWFMVSYSYEISYVVDTAYLVIGAGSILYYCWIVGMHWSTVKELLYSVLSRIVALAAGLLVSAVLVPTMVATTVQLRYLSHDWIVVAIFWLPFITTAAATSQLFDAWRAKTCGLNRSLRAAQAMTATRAILMLILLVLMTIPLLVTMRYVIGVPLVIMSIMSLISLTILRMVRIKAWHHLLLEFLLSLPSVTFIYSISLRMDESLLPVMGRNGSDTPDVTIAILNVGFAALAASTVSGIELLFSRKRLWFVVGAALAASVVIAFIPMSPYSETGPATQRHYWFHSEIISYNYNGIVTERTSGILVTKLDANTPQSVLPALRSSNLNLNYRDDFDRDCERYTYCNLPLFRLQYRDALPQALLLYTGPPAPFNPPPAIRMTNTSCIGETCTMYLTMTGPPHNLLTLHPRAQVTLAAWSMSSPVLPTAEFDGRPLYTIVHAVGTYSEPLPIFEFWIRFQVPLSMQSQPVLDLSHHAHKIHHPEDFTTEYRTIIDAMPAYFNIATFLSVRTNYEF